MLLLQPDRIEEPLYFDDRAGRAYRKLDLATYDAIVSGEKPL